MLDEDDTIHHMQIYPLLNATIDHKNKLLDFTEQKLLRIEKCLKDDKQKLALEELIRKYKEGKIAIGWRHGSPMWINLK